MGSAQVLDAMRNLPVKQMGWVHYNAFAPRITFVIAELQTECWIRAIYYPDDADKAGKAKGCIGEMRRIAAREGFKMKKPADYQAICNEHFKTKEALLNHSQPNESFKTFTKELNEKLSPQAAA